jgi:pimeloyl-ACP methyl ester carboxylesterase
MRFATSTGPVRIAYDMVGTGAPIVMLHGFGETKEFWREFGFVEACLVRARRVVLVDLRGHGDSSKPHDPTAYGAVNLIRDVVAVLDDAGIDRADFLGWGIGGRVVLDIAAFAPQRVRAVAAGGTHPFAESMQLWRDALTKGLETWVDIVEAKAGGLSATTRQRLLANDPAALTDAAAYDRPDIADALARSGVPVLLFLGEDDPRTPLALSFAEQTGAVVIGLARHGSLAPTAVRREILPRILHFFEEPADGMSSLHASGSASSEPLLHRNTDQTRTISKHSN